VVVKFFPPKVSFLPLSDVFLQRASACRFFFSYGVISPFGPLLFFSLPQPLAKRQGALLGSVVDKWFSLFLFFFDQIKLFFPRRGGSQEVFLSSFLFFSVVAGVKHTPEIAVFFLR